MRGETFCAYTWAAASSSTKTRGAQPRLVAMRANIRFKHAIPIPLKLHIGSRSAGMNAIRFLELLCTRLAVVTPESEPRYWRLWLPGASIKRSNLHASARPLLCFRDYPFNAVGARPDLCRVLHYPGADGRGRPRQPGAGR